MHSQLHISGRLLSNPEISTTKKGHPWVRLLLETELVKGDGRSGHTAETLVLPLSCFGRQAETVKDLHAGNTLTAGCHLYGTKYEGQDGAVKHGIQLVADTIYIDRKPPPNPMEHLL
jgi:single-stranded DNA-binding protein